MGLPEGLGGRGLGGDVGPVAEHKHRVASTQNALSGPAGQPEEIEGAVIKAGTHVGSPNVNGDIRVDFAKPFPTGLVTVVIFQGDVTYAIESFRGTWNASKTGFDVRFASGSGSVRINWIAVGW